MVTFIYDDHFQKQAACIVIIICGKTAHFAVQLLILC